jgi:hypothetical protein
MQPAGFDLDFEVVEWGAMLLGYRSAPDAPASKGVDALNISLSYTDPSSMFRYCAGFSDACMTWPSTCADGSVREAPRHEIALSGQRRLQHALWGFGRSRRRWDGALGKQDWVAATGSRALEDSWTSGKGVEALVDGYCEPRVRGSGTHRVVADR